jgi:hypothetical protein
MGINLLLIDNGIVFPNEVKFLTSESDYNR